MTDEQERRGIFIAFEGGDGAGKSTQIALLAERLEALGLSVLSTREPGGTPKGEALRGLLLGGAQDWTPLEEAALMSLARGAHAAEKIRPALAAGKIVLSDRFADSTRAYQGASGLSSEEIETLHQLHSKGLEPDLTLILDMDPAEAMTRAARRGSADRFEARGLAYQEELRRRFLLLAMAAPERRKLIDARGAPEEVAERVWAAARRLVEAS
ncbi:dTMP kinase [Neomegalonema perideroedes]|uniref:dTMP kinase n=1 Tax=Neomegalonema perideroedes TaxID=217219 RepID=UPI0003769A19|nr:dTMP kinase [Neomegalonema perideroedes]